MCSLPNLNLIGSSAAFRLTLERLRRLIHLDATVLIRGESGTGKELAARALHDLSARRDKPFSPINCGALPDSLFESELFGSERGAFTDARQGRPGVIGAADGGTLFFDEVDSLSIRAQSGLLRFLQDKSYRRVGGSSELRADVRVVAACNVDLEARARDKLFRPDLLYRLNVLNVTLPPLRERPGDAVELANFFIRRFSHQYDLPVKPLHPDAIEFLEQCRWPGNVRELENMIHREFLTAEDNELHFREARSQLLEGQRREPTGQQCFSKAKAAAISNFERRYVFELLDRARGNITQAARLAGKDRSAFGKLVRKYHSSELAEPLPGRRQISTRPDDSEHWK